MKTAETLQRAMQAHLTGLRTEVRQEEITEIVAAFLLYAKKNGLAITQITQQAMMMVEKEAHT